MKTSKETIFPKLFEYINPALYFDHDSSFWTYCTIFGKDFSAHVRHKIMLINLSMVGGI